MNRQSSMMFCAGLLLLGAEPARAAPIDQYAGSVIGFSSQYSASTWSAAQALGAPDTFSYGDIATAWTTQPPNAGSHYISLGYSTSVYATGATVRETYGNGFVYQIDAIDTGNILHTVWTGFDPSPQGNPVDFLVTWPMTAYLVKGLKIYVDTNHSSSWEEIDSVRLHGDSVFSAAAVPEPASLALLGLGLAAFKTARPRRQAAESRPA